MNTNVNAGTNLSRLDSELWSKMQSRISDDYDKYGRVRHITWPKKLLMPFSARIRAKVRLENYADMYKKMGKYVTKAISYEGKLQDQTISEGRREDYEDYRSMYLGKVQDKSGKMAKTATKYMKSAGYYYRIRTRRFIDSVDRLKSKSRSKRAKLEKNPFIRLYTYLRRDYRKFEKSVRNDDRDYLESAIDNVVGVNGRGKLLHNPELLSKLKPERKGMIMTVATHPDFPKSQMAIESQSPVAPVVPNVPVAPARTSISLDGFQSIESLIADNQRLSDENEQLRSAAPAMRR